MSARLFSIPSFRFSLDGAVGKWSRIATYGEKAKDGARMVFDARSLGEMVANAEARGDKIAICADHASAYPETREAPALGFFGALAVVEGGAVVKAWNGAPDADGLDDGLYGRLDSITPRGADPVHGLANFGSLSPMFSEAGTDETGKEIGFSLYDVAATNTAFQSGCSIQFHNAPGAVTTMAREWKSQNGESVNVGDRLKIRAGGGSPARTGRVESIDDLGWATVQPDPTGDPSRASVDKLAIKALVHECVKLSASPAAPVTMANVGDVVEDSSPKQRRGRVVWADRSSLKVKWNDGSTSMIDERDLDNGEGTEAHPHLYSVAPRTSAVTMAKSGEFVDCPCGHSARLDASGNLMYHTAPNGKTCDHVGENGSAMKVSARQYSAPRTGATTMAIGYKTEDATTPASFADMMRDNDNDPDLAAFLKAMKPGEKKYHGTMRIEAVQMSTGPASRRLNNGATAMAIGLKVGDAVTVADDREMRGKVIAVNGDKFTVDWGRGNKHEYDDIFNNVVKLSNSTSAPTRRFNQGAPMSPEMMTRMGLADDASDADKIEALSKYAAECEAKLAKFGDLVIKHEDEEEAEAEAVKEMASDLGVDDGPKKMSRCLAALRATRVPHAAVASLKSEVHSLSQRLAARDKADADAQLATFADRAIAEGQWDGANRDGLIAFARVDMKHAEKSLLPKGSYTLLGRITSGLANGRTAPSVNTDGRRGVAFSAKVKERIAATGEKYEIAAGHVAKAHPDLAAEAAGL